MKHILLLFSLIFILSCQENKSSPEIKTQVKRSISADIRAVLDAHGGLDNWNKWQGLTYEIVNEKGNEIQTIDLKDRRERIDASNFTMGFDGNNYWLEADSTYKGNPIFYKNLIFYFYAMPFVLGDEGILYSKTDDLEFEGEIYPGIKISYESNIGESPDDEYFMHYDSKTKQMAWLGYTVTYHSKAKSNNVKWIRYNDWSELNGILLPKSLDWYISENSVPIKFRNKKSFEKIELIKNKISAEIFAKTPLATLVKQE